MRRLLMPWRKPKVLDEAGRWSVRVALLAIDEDIHAIATDVARIATPDYRGDAQAIEQRTAKPPVWGASRNG